MTHPKSKPVDAADYYDRIQKALGLSEAPMPVFNPDQYRNQLCELLIPEQVDPCAVKQGLLKVAERIFGAQTQALFNGGVTDEGIQLSILNHQKRVVDALLFEIEEKIKNSI